jgi:hypothetical protein
MVLGQLLVATAKTTLKVGKEFFKRELEKTGIMEIDLKEEIKKTGIIEGDLGIKEAEAPMKKEETLSKEEEAQRLRYLYASEEVRKGLIKMYDAESTLSESQRMEHLLMLLKIEIEDAQALRGKTLDYKGRHNIYEIVNRITDEYTSLVNQ